MIKNYKVKKKVHTWTDTFLFHADFTVRISWWISFLIQYIETNHPDEVNRSGDYIYRLWPLFANTGRWTVCPWALFFFLLTLFWNLYQWGRATAGGGRDSNLERISHSLIFCLHLWGFETKAPLGFLTVTFFKSAQPQRCNDTLSRCFTVKQVIVLPPCECFWLLVKVCGTCRISRTRPLPNICASRINSVQPDAL